MAVITPIPKTQFIGADGVPLVGGKVYTYAAGTTTPQVTYTDSTGSTANSNPIILDSRGEANIWLGEATYKFKLTDANNVEQWTVDYISAPTTALSPVLSGNVTISTDSSGPALKITQTGTGDVLRVQDSVDPDITPFVINAAGYVGIGTIAPAEALDIDNSGKIQFSDSGTARTVISADASNSTIDVKSNRNFLVKTNGGTRLTISGSGTATFAGAVTFSGGVAVVGNSSVTGTLGVSSTLTVSSGGAVITGNSSVTGTFGVSSTFTASNGLIVSAGGAAITGNSSVTGTFGVSSTLTASNGLTVSAGGATITGNSSITGTLGVSNALTVSAGGLTVTSGGLTVSSGGAAITGNSSVTGTLSASSTLTASNGLIVSASGATITGDSSVTGTLGATGTITSSTGNIVSTAGSVSAGTTVSAGTSITAGSSVTATTAVITDTVSERTSAAGVTVDGVLIKDSAIGGDYLRIAGKTAQNTTSGTSFPFTSIPTWARRITVMFDGVSLSSNDGILVQIGPSGGLTTSGYTSTSGRFTGSALQTTSSTAGFVIQNDDNAQTHSGIMTICLLNPDAFTYVSSYTGKQGSTNLVVGGGDVTLSGLMTQLTIKATGSNTFDAGSVNVLYE